MSSPEAIIRNKSTGAGGITRLSPTVEGSGMGALLNVFGRHDLFQSDAEF